MVLDGDMDLESGDSTCGNRLPNITPEVASGDILLDDGKIVLKLAYLVKKLYVRTTGPLSNNKGINKQGVSSAKALTEKDKEDLITATKIGVNLLHYHLLEMPKTQNEARAC